MALAVLLPVSLMCGVAFYTKSLGLSYTNIFLSICATFVAQIFLNLVYQSLIGSWFFSATRKLPYPKADTFFLGNLLPFLSEPWGFPLARWQEGMPNSESGFYRVFLGPFDYVIPKTASAIAAVMSQPYLFVKPGPVRDGLILTLGVGLVAAEGDIHRKQKKFLGPIFGLERNRRLVPQMWHKALNLRDTLYERVTRSGGSEVIEMHPLTMAATLDVIGVTTIGIDFNSVNHADQPILEAYKAVFPTIENQTTWQKFFGAMLPAVVSPFILFKLPFKRIQEFHWGMTVLKGFVRDQIQAKKQEIAQSNFDNVELRQKDILSAMIASGLTDETELTSHVLTILAAGHESTAITLAWGIFKLAQLPEVQDRLRKEVEEAMANSDSDVPTLEQVNAMQYLRCFLMELLRLYPAFPSMMREPAHAASVGDLRIPQGKRIMVSPYAINRSTELWGEDADEFRVERWEESYSGGAKTSQAFMTFSSGQRICIGKDFAMISLKIFLAVLVRKFRFEEAVPGAPHPKIQKGTSLKPEKLQVRVTLLEKV